MNAEQFERRLRELIHARPFVPFVVEIDDGRAIPITEPAVAFAGGAASFVDASGEIHLLKCEQVIDFKSLAAGPIAGRADESLRSPTPEDKPTMSAEQFEQTMRTYLHRDPFEPFVVRTDQEALIVIANPKAVALASGGAGYIGPERIFFIESSDVLDIRSMKEQLAS